MANALVIRRYHSMPGSVAMGDLARGGAGHTDSDRQTSPPFSLWAVWMDDFAGTMGFVMVAADRLQALRREGASLLCAPHLRREIADAITANEFRLPGASWAAQRLS
jgi:hypothetical protein